MSHNLHIDSYIPWSQKVTRSTLRKWWPSSRHQGEYYSDGVIGLLEASKRFDHSKGKTFEQFAYPRVRGAVLDAMRRESTLSVRGYEKLKALQATETTSSLTTSSIQTSTGKGLLGQKLEYAEDSSLLADTTTNPEECFSRKQSREMLFIILKSLSAEQCQVISEHYFSGRSLSEIARSQGTTRSKMSRIHLQALERLKKLWQIRYHDTIVSGGQKPAFPYAA